MLLRLGLEKHTHKRCGEEHALWLNAGDWQELEGEGAKLRGTGEQRQGKLAKTAMGVQSGRQDHMRHLTAVRAQGPAVGGPNNFISHGGTRNMRRKPQGKTGEQ